MHTPATACITHICALHQSMVQVSQFKSLSRWQPLMLSTTTPSCKLWSIYSLADSSDPFWRPVPKAGLAGPAGDVCCWDPWSQPTAPAFPDAMRAHGSYPMGAGGQLETSHILKRDKWSPCCGTGKCHLPITRVSQVSCPGLGNWRRNWELPKAIFLGQVFQSFPARVLESNSEAKGTAVILGTALPGPVHWGKGTTRQSR